MCYIRKYQLLLVFIVPASQGTMTCTSQVCYIVVVVCKKMPFPIYIVKLSQLFQHHVS